ncbi:23S rRNA (uracil(1939)-C(5))-methyltransferase RlmD [Pyrococcus abyssi]|uniref:23S rRNA (uracil(747)-C(5))-methyltransferase n=1 Tax=Pyrococcus abyssi (strain GE5 / Orsay) TaxID=272844 RepID=ARLMC_PYRAB|nr:23S rRNA (uracil(1939)-C(5))-methyltransferase RlmD [Pyrococcus abyssi]Q9UZK1.1 RecName: Full=23S rRNA (uracil(747)-C(5))-methyltransferase; AltName: Full=23S rRNA(m5U747)-methyltransferase [Pyrococcus abyssi GE5]CAB50056.1 RNA methyltransferase, putative [Pyrococcus abyssi GE5]CCE70562.1 TPA: putative RNA methyltransferase [Pyrococcus abyssi GE5]
MRGIIKGVSNDGLGVLGEVLVPFAYPGDVVEVISTRERFGRTIARDFKLVKSSPIRVPGKCRYFGRCGGCLWQGLKYREQLKLKEEIFKRVTGVEAEIKGSPRIWFFRNISNFIVTVNGIGFKEFGMPRTVVSVDECPVFSERTKLYIRAMKRFLRETGLNPWNWKNGDVHYLQVREGKFTGEVMINVIAHIPPSGREELTEAFGFADSVYWSLKRDKRDDPKGIPTLIKGNEFIRESIEGLVYLIHPSTFFQTNSYALPILLKAVESFAEGSKVLDLYSGVGTFSLYLAKKGFEVTGVEVNEESVRVAKKSAEVNSLDVSFIPGRAEDAKLKGYETLIVDPPRKGLKDFSKRIAKEGPENLIYVSCNPSKFVLDYRNYLSKAYKIEDAVLIDMFPHTPHVEAVVKLRRR